MTKLQYLHCCLAEEAAEVAKEAMKCVRFGTGDKGPGEKLTNLEKLASEMRDLLAVADLLCAEGSPMYLEDATHAEEKKKRVARWMDYSRELGVVEEVTAEQARKLQESLSAYTYTVSHHKVKNGSRWFVYLPGKSGIIHNRHDEGENVVGSGDTFYEAAMDALRRKSDSEVPF